MATAQPYAAPTTDQTLTQYLAGLGQLPSYGPNSYATAATEYNADTTDPGYVQTYGQSAPGGDFQSLTGLQTGPTGLPEVPTADVTPPSAPSWWENAITYGIPLAAGAGIGDAITGGAISSAIEGSALGDTGALAAPAVGSDALSTIPSDVPGALPETPAIPDVTTNIPPVYTAPGTDLSSLAQAGVQTLGGNTGADLVDPYTYTTAPGDVVGPPAPPDLSGVPPPLSSGQNINIPGVGDTPSLANTGTDLSSILSTLKGYGVNPLSAASLLASIAMKPKIPNQSDITGLASAIQSNTAGLQGIESADIAAGQTGQLPAGAQTQINQAEQSAEAAIKSKYASMGLSGSTMEQQDLISARNAAVAQQFNEAQTLANQGVQIAGVINSADATSAQIYETIMNTVLQQDSALQAALANFAGATAIGAAIAARNG